MPARLIGDVCDHCHRRPVWSDGLCSPCWHLQRLTGTPPPRTVTPAHDSDSAEFERELRDWLADQ